MWESTEEEKQEGYGQIPQTKFSKVGAFDPTADDEVPQRCVQPHLDRAAIAVGHGKFDGSAKIPAEY